MNFGKRWDTYICILNPWNTGITKKEEEEKKKKRKGSETRNLLLLFYGVSCIALRPQVINWQTAHLPRAQNFKIASLCTQRATSITSTATPSKETLDLNDFSHNTGITDTIISNIDESSDDQVVSKSTFDDAFTSIINDHAMGVLYWCYCVFWIRP